MLYFAWCAAGAPFDPGEHAVHDLDIRALVIAETEGQAATAVVTVEDDGAGLLALGVRHCWISCAMSDGDGAPVVVPLFHGRLTGVPQNQAGAFVDYEFDVRLSGIEDQIASALAPYRVAPGWDPLFCEEGRDADLAEVLDGYHAMLVLSAIGGAARVVDALLGDAAGDADAVLEVPGALGPYDGLTVQAVGTPLARVDWSLTATWTQTGSGVVDVGAALVRAAGGPIRTLSPANQFAATWPAVGEDLGGGGDGYRVLSAALLPQVPADGKWPVVVWSNFGGSYRMDLQTYAPDLRCGWSYTQARREVARGSLIGAAQPVVAASPAEVGAEDMALRPVDQPVLLADGTLLPAPIGDARRAQFFATDRGRAAVEHALQVVAVRLAESQRCVEVERVLPWPDGRPDLVTADCGACLRIHHPRLPGGAALGKIARRELRWEGGGGLTRSLRLAIRCSIGQGYAAVPVPGGDGDQVFAGDVAVTDVVAAIGGSRAAGGSLPIVYEDYADQGPPADGSAGLVDLIGLGSADLVLSATVERQAEAQEAAIMDGGAAVAVAASLRAIPTRAAFALRDLAAVDADAATVTVAVVTPAPFGRQATIDLGG